MLWQLLALHLEMSFFEMQPPWFIHCPFTLCPHSWLSQGSKTPVGLRERKGDSRTIWYFQARAYIQFPFCYITLFAPQYCTSTSLGKSSATQLISMVQKRGQKTIFHPEPRQVWSGIPLDSIAWHSSQIPCKFKVQQCIPVILRPFSITPLVQLSPQPQRNATSVQRFASCCPLQEALGVVISQVISH